MYTRYVCVTVWSMAIKMPLRRILVHRSRWGLEIRAQTFGNSEAANLPAKQKCTLLNVPMKWERQEGRGLSFYPIYTHLTAAWFTVSLESTQREDSQSFFSDVKGKRGRSEAFPPLLNRTINKRIADLPHGMLGILGI